MQDKKYLYKNKFRVASARRDGYDYSDEGFYFITICAAGKKCFFGTVDDFEMRLSEIGEIAQKFWEEIPLHFDNTKLHEFIIMPNHLHGIIQIIPGRSRDFAAGDVAVQRLYGGDHLIMSRISPKASSLSVVIRSYKSACTNFIRNSFKIPNFEWQERFYDRVIRDEEEFNAIRQYVIDNPLKWELDENNPKNS
jgi:putative transposase